MITITICERKSHITAVLRASLFLGNKKHHHQQQQQQQTTIHSTNSNASSIVKRILDTRKNSTKSNRMPHTQEALVKIINSQKYIYMEQHRAMDQPYRVCVCVYLYGSNRNYGNQHVTYTYNTFSCLKKHRHQVPHRHTATYYYYYYAYYLIAAAIAAIATIATNAEVCCISL